MNSNPFLSSKNIKIIYDAVSKAAKKKFHANIGNQYYQQLNSIVRRIFSISRKSPHELSKSLITKMNKEATKELFQIISYDFKNESNHSSSQYAFLGNETTPISSQNATTSKYIPKNYPNQDMNHRTGLYGRPIEHKKNKQKIPEREMSDYVRDPSRENMPLILSERSDYLSRGVNKSDNLEKRYHELQNTYRANPTRNTGPPSDKVFDANGPFPDNRIKTENRNLDKMFNKTHHSQVKNLETKFKQYELNRTEDLYEQVMSRRNEMDKYLQESLSKDKVKLPQPKETRDDKPMTSQELKEESHKKYKKTKKHIHPKELKEFTEFNYGDNSKSKDIIGKEIDINDIFKENLVEQIEKEEIQPYTIPFDSQENKTNKEEIKKELKDIELLYKKKIDEEIKKRELDLQNLTDKEKVVNNSSSSKLTNKLSEDNKDFEFSLNEFIDSDDDNYVENEKALLKEHRKDFDLEQIKLKKEFEEYQKQLDEKGRAINERADQFKIILQEREQEILVKEEELYNLESKLEEEQNILLKQQNVYQELHKELIINTASLKEKEIKLNELESFLDEKETSFSELEKEYEDNKTKIKLEYEKIKNTKLKVYEEIEKYKKDNYKVINDKILKIEEKEKKLLEDTIILEDKEKIIKKREELLWEKVLNKSNEPSSSVISLDDKEDKNKSKINSKNKKRTTKKEETRIS